MKRIKSLIDMSGLLKWLTKTVLVLGLITFSGNVSGFGLYNAAPAKTELSEVRSGCSKRTVCFNKVFDRLNYATSLTGNFIFYLLHQENSIAVKLKINFKELPIDQQDGLIYYATKSFEEFEIYHLRG